MTFVSRKFQMQISNKSLFWMPFNITGKSYGNGTRDLKSNLVYITALNRAFIQKKKHLLEYSFQNCNK